MNLTIDWLTLLILAAVYILSIPVYRDDKKTPSLLQLGCLAACDYVAQILAKMRATPTVAKTPVTTETPKAS